MNYEDEPYVRLYTRNTATWELLEWEGQTVLMHMLRDRFDRAGVFDCGKHKPEHAIKAVTKLPLSLIEVGLARLLEFEVWQLQGTKLIWPRYLYAQTCTRSDRLRQEESRKNRRDRALASSTENESRSVTEGHEPSQTSQSVTLSLAEQSNLPPPSGEGSPAKPAQRKPGKVSKRWRKVPESWRPNEQHRAMARALAVDFETELASFRDHEFKDPKSDADACFRTWLRKAPRYQAGASKTPPGRLKHDELEERRVRRNRLIEDAKAGRYGPNAQLWAEKGKNLGGLADKLEEAEAKRASGTFKTGAANG